MKRYLCLLIIVLTLSGCAKLAHLRELLTLDALSKNQTKQNEYVEAADARFEKLLAAVREEKGGEYPDKAAVTEAFGKPVYVKDITEGGRTMERWLYRYAVYYSREKVYVYFDGDGRKVRWQLMPSKEKPKEVADE